VSTGAGGNTNVKITDDGGSTTDDCAFGASASTCTVTPTSVTSIIPSETITLYVASTQSTPAEDLTCTIEGLVSVE
jgi:hypothetical protein